MPFTFSVAQYAGMIYVYGFCDGNSVLAVAEYQQRFPNSRIPNRRVFTRVYQTLRDTGTLPGVPIAAERGVNEGVDEEEGIVLLWMNFGDTNSYGPGMALITFEAFKVFGKDAHEIHAVAHRVRDVISTVRSVAVRDRFVRGYPAVQAPIEAATQVFAVGPATAPAW